MATNDWIRLDANRPSWVFLLLGTEELNNGTQSNETERIQYWEVGIGNADEFISTTAKKIDCAGIASESDLISKLLEELNSYRYETELFITPTHEEIRYLRQSLVRFKREQSSLRGFAHLSLEEKLEAHFDQTLSDYRFQEELKTQPRQTETTPPRVVSTGSSRRLWELWKQIFRLLPAGEITGERL